MTGITNCPLIKVHQNTPISATYEVIWKYQIAQSNMKYLLNNTLRSFLDISEEHQLLNQSDPTIFLVTRVFHFQMLSLMEHMYQELGLIEEFGINTVVLRRFLVSQRNISLERKLPYKNDRDDSGKISREAGEELYWTKAGGYSQHTRFSSKHANPQNNELVR